MLDSRTLQVFAPVDAAFESVPTKYLEDQWQAHLTDILLYHVVGAEVFSGDLMMEMMAETVNGENITVTSLDPVQINGIDVIVADVNASNGVIHAIDEVLLPPSATNNIVELGAADPVFSTLVDLVTSAGLVETLSGDGPFTLFAPTNDAFAKLPTETLDFLTDPANIDALADVLTFHVVPGIVLSSDLSMGLTQTAVNGGVLNVTSMDPVTLNDSIVVGADVLANNGVVHVIDTVLVPPEDTEPEPEVLGTIVDIAVADEQFSTLVAALTASQLVEALQGEGPFTVRGSFL